MCEHPFQVMQDWEHHPLLSRVIWHTEAPVHHKELIAWCRQRELSCGIALNPETPLETIASFALQIDLILLLSVHPGWSGQPFIPTTIEKLRRTYEQYPYLSIGIDGGVNEDLIPLLSTMGATELYVGSDIFHAHRATPAQALRHLQMTANQI
jgi:ribulose-phosphate 3-epimerase